jgi:hypothetical protein
MVQRSRVSIMPDPFGGRGSVRQTLSTSPSGNMNKTFQRIGVVLALLAMLVFVVPFGLPGQYRVMRNVTINAPPAAIHPSVNTLREWPDWSAWTVAKYPDLKITNSGPEAGVGAIDEFEGESVGGHGKFEITKSDPDEGIEYNLDFDRGMYVSTGGIKYAKDEGATNVTWTNEGELGWSPISRWCNALGLLDAAMGPDLETGLANLKKKVEAEVAAAAEKAPPERRAEEPAAEKP